MNVSERGKTKPLWLRIRETLTEEIDQGRYAPGTKLPTEAELSKRFAVNRHTVRRALDALRSEGRIHVRRGSGAYVTQGRFDYPIGPRTRLGQNLAQLGLSARRNILRLETLPADPREASQLDIEVGAPTLLMEQIGEANDVPITYSTSVFPVERLAGFEPALRRNGSVTEALAAVGIEDYRREWTRLTAERPGAMIARHLRMPDIHPVLHAEALNTCAEGRPVEYGNTWFCSDRVQLVVDRVSFHEELSPLSEAAE